MVIQEGYFYHLSDTFFEEINDKTLMSNKENGGYRLQPENDTMEPIYLNEVAVLGRVVALLRYMD